MKTLLLPIPFAALTILAWGSYGNWLHAARPTVDDLRMRQLFCVGLAYFILAIVIPTLFIKLKGEKGEFTVSGIIWSLAAGVCGALGALGIIMALSAGGAKAPVYVMPLVFGCAPVVNTLVSMTMNRNLKEANSAFLAGIVLVAVGAALVFINKPKADPHHAPSTQEKTSETSAEPETEKKITKVVKQAAVNWLTVISGILLTALSWGTYGSVLHKGQALMKGSRLRDRATDVNPCQSPGGNGFWWATGIHGRGGRSHRGLWHHPVLYLWWKTDLHHATRFRWSSHRQYAGRQLRKL